jgi:hypothetical protein
MVHLYQLAIRNLESSKEYCSTLYLLLLGTDVKIDIHTILNSIEISQGGSNTDSGYKRRVQCRNIITLYLAFIFRHLLKVKLIKNVLKVLKKIKKSLILL